MAHYIVVPGRKPKLATHALVIGDMASVHRTEYLACADRTARTKARNAAKTLDSNVTVDLCRVCACGKCDGDLCRPMATFTGQVDAAKRDATRALIADMRASGLPVTLETVRAELARRAS